MEVRSKRTLAVAGAVVALATGSGAALAAGGNGGGPGPGGPHGPGGPGSAAIATYLGLSQADLRTQLESGKTLAQVATAQGKSVSGLEDAIYADAKAHLDQAVADGKLTAAQEQTMLSELKSHLDDLVNRTGGPPAGDRGPGKGPGPQFGAAAASYLGLTEAELRTQLESGKTLAQVATAQGKSVEGLKQAILTAAKTKLDADVAAGKLTAAQEQTMLDNLKAHIDDIVNNAGPPRGPKRHR